MNFLRNMTLQRLLLLGLVLCMGLAQSISVAHRALHHDVRMLAHAYEEAHEENHAHSHSNSHEADCDHGWLGKLFASHEDGDESCRLMDGASGFDMLFNALVGIESALNAHLFIAVWQTERAAWAALGFEARGPPALSL
jgi:hypothetical protein